MSYKITILFMVVLFIIGCKKYPEDPAIIHLRTAKQRLTQRSFITIGAGNFITGNNYSGTPGNDYIYFYKNGNFLGENALFFKFNGKWEFEDNKNNLRIYNDTKSLSFQIVRLDAHFLSIKNDSIRCNYKNTRP